MKNLRHVLLLMLAPFGLASCSHRLTLPKLQEPVAMNQNALSESLIVEFLHRFEKIANEEDFSKIRDMIHERAFFRFNDGDFVGRQAIQQVFEKTWKSAGDVKKTNFYLTDVIVLSVDKTSATATYTYNWEGAQGEKQFRIQGRGTRVLVLEDGRLQIIHEHLSRFPKL
jgi:ketosteroid isomerase-like protein